MFPPEQPSQGSVVLCFQSCVTLLDPAVGCRLVPSCSWANGEGWGLQVQRWVGVGSAGPPTHAPRDCRLSPLHFLRMMFVPPVQPLQRAKSRGRSPGAHISSGSSSGPGRTQNHQLTFLVVSCFVLLETAATYG